MKNRKRNEIVIVGNPVALPDALFLLFLRLVVGLHESGDGFVSRGALSGGGWWEKGSTMLKVFTRRSIGCAFG